MIKLAIYLLKKGELAYYSHALVVLIKVGKHFYDMSIGTF